MRHFIDCEPPMLAMKICDLCVSIPAALASVAGAIGSGVGAVGSAIGSGLGAIGGELGIGGAAADAGAGLDAATASALYGSGSAAGGAGVAGAGGLSNALLASAGINGLTGLTTGLIGSNAAGSAAQLQYNAAQQAIQTQLSMYNTNRQLLNPFVTAGTGALGQLQNLTGTNAGGNPLTSPLTQPFTPADLTNYPGYQFTLQQGQLATQNGFAAQGLGRSGAALKGAANYAEGLAGTTYGQAFNQDLATKLQIYNMLSGITGTGANAAGMTAGIGTGAVNAISGLTTGGGAALAGGVIGGTNALTGGLNATAGGVGQALTLPYILPYLTGNGLYGGSNASTNPNG